MDASHKESPNKRHQKAGFAIPSVRPSHESIALQTSLAFCLVLSLCSCSSQAPVGGKTALDNGIKAPDKRAETNSSNHERESHSPDVAVPIAPVGLPQVWRQIDDPTKDGWTTEAFSEQAGQQLDRLGQFLVDGASHAPSALADLVTDDFSCAPLAPAELEQVYRDEVLEVVRAAPVSESGKRASTETPRGPRALASALGGILAPLRDVQNTRFKFKIFRVNRQEHTVITEQYFSLSARTPDGAVEQHATWTINWQIVAQDAPPKLSRIEVVDFEQVRSKHAAPWFSDYTAAMLHRNECYGSQFQRGYNHWAQRVQDTRYFSLLGAPALAVGDVNGDGLEDLFVGQETGLPNRLFVQLEDGTLRDDSAAAGVDWLDGSRGALLLDLDNDGDQDLALAIVGGVVLAANDGQARFEIRAVLPTDDDTMSLCAADYDNDGDLDLYVCVYSPNDEAGQSPTRSSIAASNQFVFHDANNGGRNSLWRNDTAKPDEWQFKNVTTETGLDENNRRYSLAAAWEDYDNDGDQDLYVANDFGRNNLYRNDAGKFVDVAQAAAAEDSSPGMSVSWADYNRDGHVDLYVGNMFSAAGNRITYQPHFKDEASDEVKRRIQRFAKGNTLLASRGDDTFDDVSIPAAVNVGRWAWGSNFFDVNNDGWDDLIVANGFITTNDTSDL